MLSTVSLLFVFFTRSTAAATVYFAVSCLLDRTNVNNVREHRKQRKKKQSEYTRSTKSKFSNLDTFTAVAMSIRLFNSVSICHSLYTYVRCTVQKSDDFWQQQIAFITYFAPYIRFNRKLFAFYVILLRLLVFDLVDFLSFSAPFSPLLFTIYYSIYRFVIRALSHKRSNTYVY